MVVITDIEELLQRERDCDVPATEGLAAAQASHRNPVDPDPEDKSPWFPDLVWHSGREPRVDTSKGKSPVAQCSISNCRGPMFLVRDNDTGLTMPWCRTCINVVRRQSHVHNRSIGLKICLNCEFDYDSLGLIKAANHGTEYIPDQLVTRNGLWEIQALDSAFNDKFTDVNQRNAMAFDNFTDFETWIVGIKGGAATDNKALQRFQRSIDSTLSLTDWITACHALIASNRIRIPVIRTGLNTLIAAGKVDLTDGVVTWEPTESWA